MFLAANELLGHVVLYVCLQTDGIEEEKGEGFPGRLYARFRTANFYFFVHVSFNQIKQHGPI